ncbi:helix-turn-helix transcriptional regulator [Aliikangiella sp. IMCC44359]|uniref:helix-turn-helix transcriptional regulator n=1 Tax=Aliikangiella sp. IMCC44359 TaxID=3459125 RepID=UPI00403B266B
MKDSTLPLQYYLRLIKKIRTTLDLQHVCSDVASEYGCKFYCFAMLIRYSIRNPTYHVISNYPQAWINYYLEHDCKSYDPVFQYWLDNTTPSTWHDIVNHTPEITQQNINFMQAAAKYGLKTGISFPLHGPHGDSSGLNLSHVQTLNPRLTNLETVSKISLLCQYLHQAAYKLLNALNKEKSIQKNTLNLREKECLLWCTEGKSSWEISIILGITENVVVKHLQRACIKLGAHNRQQAVAKAVSLGIFDQHYLEIVKSYTFNGD